MIRVFPRRTRWTPNDEFAFVGDPPLFRPPEQPVKISVAFKWDLSESERLYRAWKTYCEDVDIGGPATGEKEGDFVPGRFLKKGAVITSRGCHNQCWFCEAWKRNGRLQELPITEGWNVMDDNLLECSDRHFLSVCDMLQKQSHKPVFSGGLEAKLLKRFHAERIVALKPERIYFAYDTEDDFEPLIQARNSFILCGLTTSSHDMAAYVLIGYPEDTMVKAEKRLKKVLRLGVMPMAMLYRDENGKHSNNSWLSFQKHWARPWYYEKTENQDAKPV